MLRSMLQFIFSLLLVLWTQELSLGQVCDRFAPEDKVVQYGNSINLDCDTFTSYRWWQSNDNCSSFNEFSSCSDVEHCRVVVNGSTGTFYHYCCTPREVMALTPSTMTATTCFHIQVCTDITNSVGPPVTFFGTQERIHVQLHAEPPPKHTFLMLTLHLHQSGSTIELPEPSVEIYSVPAGDVALLTYVYTIDIPHTNESVDTSGTLEFVINYETAATCLGSMGTTDTTVFVPVIAIPGIAPTTGILQTQTNTPSPSQTPPKDGPSSSSGSSQRFEITLAVCLPVIFILVTCIVVTLLLCKWQQLRLRKKYRLPTGESSYDPLGHYSTVSNSQATTPASEETVLTTNPPVTPPRRPPGLPFRDSAKQTLLNVDGTAAVTPATPTPIAPTPTMLTTIAPTPTTLTTIAPTPTTQMPSTLTSSTNDTIYDGIKDGQHTHLSEEGLSSEIKSV